MDTAINPYLDVVADQGGQSNPYLSVLNSSDQATRNAANASLYQAQNTNPDQYAQAKAIGAQALFPRKTWVSSQGVAAAHKAGLAVSTWTANTKNEMKRMVTCGVDAIATNFPDRLRSLMS